MIKKLKEYIDYETFIMNVTNRIQLHENIIIDSFISNTCNLKCPHCYFLDYKPIRNPLLFGDWSRLIGDFMEQGVRHFHFSGKEPFCDERIPAILSSLDSVAKERKLIYGFVSNGTCFNSEDINSLLNSNLSYLEISIDGNYEYDSKIRGASHYSIIKNNIIGVKDRSKINMTSTIFHDNHQELEEMICEFAELGINKFNFAPFCTFAKEKLQPTNEIGVSSMLLFIERCLMILKKIAKQKPIDIRICLTKKQALNLFKNDNLLSNKISDFILNGKEIIYIINGNILEINYPLLNIPYLYQMVITHDGFVIPCADDIHYEKIYEMSLGNVLDCSTNEIMTKREKYITDYLRDAFS